MIQVDHSRKVRGLPLTNFGVFRKSFGKHIRCDQSLLDCNLPIKYHNMFISNDILGAIGRWRGSSARVVVIKPETVEVVLLTLAIAMDFGK